MSHKRGFFTSNEYSFRPLSDISYWTRTTALSFSTTGVAPLPRYYGLIRLLLSLSLFAVLPSSLAELSKHAATFAPRGPLRSALPSPPATSPPGFALRRIAFPPPKSIRRLHVGFMLT